MRHYHKPSSIGASLSYPPNGKRFSRVLVETDAGFTSRIEVQALVALGERWDEALRWVKPRRGPRLG